jgi:hypothetical protein
MHCICATGASAFILRRCAPVNLFVYQAPRLFERACRTGAGAKTPSTHARQCSNSPLAVVGAFHFARKSIAWDFRLFVNKIDALLQFSTCEGAKSCPDFCGGVYYRSTDGEKYMASFSRHPIPCAVFFATFALL